MGVKTNYTINGSDIGDNLVDKSYMIDRYPELVGTFKQSGLWLWGNSYSGALGDNTGTSRSSPVQTVAGGTNWKLIGASAYYTAAIKTDGTLWTWGLNNFGQLGDNTTTTKSSPVQTIAGGTNWKSVDGSNTHTAAIKTDGTLWLWGLNNYGQLGDNTRIRKSSPVQTISGGTNWKQVISSPHYTAAIKTDGTLWLWGRNNLGQLGDNTRTNTSSPVQTISGGTNWKLVAAGREHTAAIKTDGTLWLWGSNGYGRLGINTGGGSSSSPVQTVAGGTNWKQVACGSLHTAAIKTDGTLWLWGYNRFHGPLGDNTLTDKSSPVQTIAAGNNWKQVSCGNSFTAAIKTDGTLWVWGRNSEGRLGDNTTTHKSSPVQTISGGTNWKLVSCGGEHTACIRDDSADIFGDSY